MSNPFQTKEFKELHAKWEKRLEKEGLPDIDKPNGQLKGITHGDRFKSSYNQIEAEAKVEYFREAGYFLHEHTFENVLERRIWELHVDGVSIRETAKILKSMKYKTNKDKVQVILKRMVDKLLLKMKVK